MWTIYDHPLDDPDHYVARRFEIDNGIMRTDDTMRSEELIPLREIFMRQGLVPLARNDNDEPQIVETWL